MIGLPPDVRVYLACGVTDMGSAWSLQRFASVKWIPCGWYSATIWMGVVAA